MFNKYDIDKINLIRIRKIKNLEYMDLHFMDYNIIDNIIKNYKFMRGIGLSPLFELIIFEYKNQIQNDNITLLDNIRKDIEKLHRLVDEELLSDSKEALIKRLERGIDGIFSKY